MKITEQKAKSFYKDVESFLIQMAGLYGLSKEDLEMYYHCEPQYDIAHGAKMSDVYKRLLSSLQNRQSLPNIIKFWDPEYEKYYEKTLCQYNPKEVVKKYGGDNGAKILFDTLDAQLHWNKEHSKLPEQWCEGAIGAAKELSKYKDSKDLHKKLMSEAKNGDLMQIAKYWDSLPIKGLGFALSCDFLKEIGIDLPKPDVHIMAVIKALFYKENEDVSEQQLTTDFIQLVKAIQKFDPELTAYKLDKMIWLICTGSFYLHKDSPKTMRECLIKKCK